MTFSQSETFGYTDVEYSGGVVVLCSRWYGVNYSLAEHLVWGQELGCDFVTKSCLDWMETRRARQGQLTKTFFMRHVPQNTARRQGPSNATAMVSWFLFWAVLA